MKPDAIAGAAPKVIAANETDFETAMNTTDKERGIMETEIRELKIIYETLTTDIDVWMGEGLFYFNDIASTLYERLDGNIRDYYFLSNILKQVLLDLQDADDKISYVIGGAL